MNCRVLGALLVLGLTSCQTGDQPPPQVPAHPTQVVAALAPPDSSRGEEQYSSSEEEQFYVSVLPTDSSLVFPVVQQPPNLCLALEQAWQAYLRQHPGFKRRFPMEAGNLGLVTSFWLTLDKRGHVQAVSKPTSTGFEQCCYQALRSPLAATVWRPFYRKTKVGKRYAPLKVHVNCYLSPAYKLTLRLDGFSPFSSLGNSPIVEYGICKCGQR